MIRTGSIGIDNALGGGWRPGTMNEIWGESGSGKTVLARHTAENAIRDGMTVLWIDLAKAVEHMDGSPAKMIVGRPRNAEDAFAMAMEACVWPDIGLVVVDPTQHLVRQAEIDGDPDYEPHPQREYRLELNDIKKAAALHGTTVLFVSQPRNTERQPVRGTGISEKVLYRVILHADVTHQDGMREVDAHVKDVAARTVRHKVARLRVRPGSGIDQARELAELAVRHDLIPHNGDWYRPATGVRLQGITALAGYLRGHPEVMHVLEMTVRAQLGFWVADSRKILVPS